MNFEPSIHNGLHETPREEPNNPPEVHGRLTRSVIERRNDYIHARGRYCTMLDWERDDLVLNMGTLLGPVRARRAGAHGVALPAWCMTTTAPVSAR